MRHLMSPLDFSVEELDRLLDLAHDIEKNPDKYAHLCDGKRIATLFYEPSTRTRLSFEAAMMNLGGKVLGFSSAEEKDEYEEMKEDVSKALKEHFRPEFLNRLDDIIVFHKLTEEEAGAICGKLIDGLGARLGDRDIRIYEICEIVGYSDPNYFSKIFRKAVGMSPEKYRKQIIGEDN